MAKVADTKIVLQQKPLHWVQEIKVLDADDKVAVNATLDNPGWHLLQTGIGRGGQPVLVFAWGNYEEA